MPVAALGNKARSDKKIKHKLKLLQDFISDGVPFLYDVGGDFVMDKNNRRRLDYFPKSVSAVAAWTVDMHCSYNRKVVSGINQLERFDRNKVSDKNRKGSARLREEIDDLLVKIKKRVSSQLDNESKSEKQKLKEQCELLKLQNESLKNCFMGDREAVEKAGQEAVEMCNIHARIEKELKLQIEKLQSKNKILATQIENLEIAVSNGVESK